MKPFKKLKWHIFMDHGVVLTWVAWKVWKPPNKTFAKTELSVFKF